MATAYIWQETGSPDNILTEAGDNLVQEDHSAGAVTVGTAQVLFVRSRLSVNIEQTRIYP